MILFVGVAVLAIGLLFTLACVRRSEIGLLGAVVNSLLLVTTGDPQAGVGGLHLSIGDLVSFCLIAAGVIRTVQRTRTLSGVRIVGFIYLLLFAFSLARGFAENGFIVASNESRGMLGELLAFLYFMDADVSEGAIRRYVKIYVGYGIILCLITVLAAMGLPVGGIAISYASAAGIGTRYIPADTTGAIATSWIFLLAVYQYRKRGLIMQVLPVVLLVFAIYLRHRTVWVLLLGCCFLMPFFDVRLFRQILPMALLATVAIGGLAIFGNTHMAGADESDFENSASNASTWEWRVNGWKELFFDETETPAVALIGKSLGSGYWRIDPDTHMSVTVAPHNEFMQNYVRVGIIGAICMMTFLIRPVFLLWRASSWDRLTVYPSVPVWGLVSFAMVSFCITYSLNEHQLALVGIANAIATRLARDRRASLAYPESADWESGTLTGQAV